MVHRNVPTKLASLYFTLIWFSPTNYLRKCDRVILTEGWGTKNKMFNTHNRKGAIKHDYCITFGSRRIQNFFVDFCFVLQLAHMYSSVSSSCSTSIKLDKQSATTALPFNYRTTTQHDI